MTGADGAMLSGKAGRGGDSGTEICSSTRFWNVIAPCAKHAFMQHGTHVVVIDLNVAERGGDVRVEVLVG